MGKIIAFKSKQEIVIPAGSYFLGNLLITYPTKPNWFRRLCVRWFLGATWVDIDPKRYVEMYNLQNGVKK